MRAVWKREWQAMFTTPIGYVFMGLFLLVSGYFFWGYNLSSSSSDMSGFFDRIAYILVMFVPVLTMRLLSEERRNKTDQLLITSPMSIWGIVMGKFLSAASVLLTTLAVTLLYPVIVAIFGTLSVGMVFTSYLGCFLLGCVYIAIGLLISSICENQLTAAIVTLVVNILLQVLEFVPQMLPAGSTFAFVGRLFGWLSLSTRNTEFAVGLLSPSNVLYLISFAGVLLFLTVRVIEKRRWSEN